MTRTEVLAKIEKKAQELINNGDASTRPQAIAKICETNPELYSQYATAEMDEIADPPVAPTPVAQEETVKQFAEGRILARADEIQKTGIPRLQALDQALAEKIKLYQMCDDPRIANKPLSQVVPPPQWSVSKQAATPSPTHQPVPIRKAATGPLFKK